MNKQTHVNKDNHISMLLLLLVVVFVGFHMISNILANRLVQLGPWSIDAGTLTFPITYILSDVFSEVYGYKWSRRVSWLSAGMNVALSLLIMLACVLPAPDWYDSSHFLLAIGSSYRIVLASLISYVCGDYVNDKVFRRFKNKHKGIEGFSMRAIISSLFGETVDTSLFVIIAFTGTMLIDEMLYMILISIVLKTGYEVIILPVTYRIACWVQNHETSTR